MPDLQLTESDQAVLRSLLAAEPTPGQPLPGRAVFQAIDRLVSCDELGAVYADLHGRISQSTLVFPHGHGEGSVVTRIPAQDRSDHGGPFHLGFMYWRDHPAQAEHCGNDLRSGDGLAIGFRNGSDAVVQYVFGRESRQFSARDLAVLNMLGPVFQRLSRERATPPLPGNLTITERRVLAHVAAGRSNAEIAESLCVAVATVRKHLENSYRKLGVSNRAAALARLQGRDHTGLDLRERLDRYA